MKTVTFLKKTYITEPGPGAPDGAISLDDLSGHQLVLLFNLVQSNLGERQVKKFSDRKTGTRRTIAALEKWDSSDPGEESEPKAKKTSAKKPEPRFAEERIGTRGMHFVFPYHGDENMRVIRDVNSLRGRVATLLEKGGTFEQVVDVVEQFDKDRGHSPGNVRRRAYEVTRILHYYIGYGMKQDDAGVITIHRGTK